MDCMDAMREFPDGYFDLSLVDPPYGIGIDKAMNANKGKQGFKLYNKTDWDSTPPDKCYFKEIMRVSKNQIIWGANYFVDNLIPSQGWIVWNKVQRDFTMSDAELAYTSFDRTIRCFDLSRGGAMGDANKHGSKIHPTQKPVKLYEWIYMNYLPNGGKVLDTHLGSGSNRIAADKMGNIEFYGYEIDKEYFDASVKRFETYKSQGVLEFPME